MRDSNSRSAYAQLIYNQPRLPLRATRLGAIDETRTRTPCGACPSNRRVYRFPHDRNVYLVGDERLERSRPRGRQGLSPPGLPIPPVADKTPRQRFERRFAG